MQFRLCHILSIQTFLLAINSRWWKTGPRPTLIQRGLTSSSFEQNLRSSGNVRDTAPKQQGLTFRRKIKLC